MKLVKDEIKIIAIFIFAIFILTILLKVYFPPTIFIVCLLFLSLSINSKINSFKVMTRSISAILTLLIVNVSIVIIMVMISYFIAGEFYSFVQNKDVILEIKSIGDKIFALTSIDIRDVGKFITSLYNEFLNVMVVTKGIKYTSEFLLSYFIANITVYFILKDKYAILKIAKKLVPSNVFEEILDIVLKIYSIITVQIKLVVLTTIITIISFYILGINNAIVFGVICGILDILPYIGTIIIFLFLISKEIMLGKTFVVIGLILVYILLEIIRQILEAKFISDILSIHPLSIMISIYIGFNIFGALGLFVGPLCIVVAKEIYEKEVKA
ncbi:AI-2E family transporter [Clostridium bornimense]|uniref:AI-2E family transporter n=2 Tax=Clostridium TaxID=1485 RepID=UPI001C101B91|nr:AI-2E family transporter [uncultured Clostridium sp.]MBU5317146.1 AI-2E family transporter [Clostridium bornimense]